MLDCKPFMMRGVSYSPVPWSHDPSYHEPFGDYFTDEFHDIVKRDLALFVEMGANTVRLYAWRLKTRHMKFLDLAFDLGLVVSAAFEMGTAEDTPIGSAQERAIALAHLQRRLQISKHRALVMWQVTLPRGVPLAITSVDLHALATDCGLTYCGCILTVYLLGGQRAQRCME